MELHGAHGVRVHYVGGGKTDSDAAAIRANNPMPTQLGVYYYEVTIVSKGRDGYIGIGFCGKDVSLQRLPGWEQWSWGYHGDDGHAFDCSGTGRPYGPAFGTGDVIGCGVNLVTKQGFFTKNAVYLGIAFEKLKIDNGRLLYPCVGLRTPGEIIEANFEKSPFKFDIERYVRDQQDSLIQTQLLPMSLCVMGETDNEQSLMHELVLDYLIHRGYADSAHAFATDAGMGVNGDMDMRGFNDARDRKSISQLILAGNIEQAISAAERFYPGCLSGKTGERTLFNMKCRWFVEMVVAANMTTKSDNGSSEDNDFERVQEALIFGQHLQDSYRDNEDSSIQQQLVDMFSLLAYRDARQSPMGDLLDIKHRITLADDLNECIMQHCGADRKSRLEKVRSQLTLVTSVAFEERCASAGFMRGVSHNLLNKG